MKVYVTKLWDSIDVGCQKHYANAREKEERATDYTAVLPYFDSSVDQTRQKSCILTPIAAYIFLPPPHPTPKEEWKLNGIIG